MKLFNSGDQHVQSFLFDASGTILSGGVPQLLVPQHQSRCFFSFENTSNESLYLDFGVGAGPAYLYATLSGHTVGSVTIVNPGFNFTFPPLVRFLGGGQPDVTHGSLRHTGLNTLYVGAAGPGFPSPANPAQGIAVLGSSSIALNQVNSITINNPGSGYVVAPYVMLIPSDLDPNGVVVPGSTYPTSIEIIPTGSVTWESTACTTDAVSVVGATQGDSFICKFMT